MALYLPDKMFAGVAKQPTDSMAQSDLHLLFQHFICVRVFTFFFESFVSNGIEQWQWRSFGHEVIRMCACTGWQSGRLQLDDDDYNRPIELKWQFSFSLSLSFTLFIDWDQNLWQYCRIGHCHKNTHDVWSQVYPFWLELEYFTQEWGNRTDGIATNANGMAWSTSPIIDSMTIVIWRI